MDITSLKKAKKFCQYGYDAATNSIDFYIKFSTGTPDDDKGMERAMDRQSMFADMLTLIERELEKCTF